MKRNIYMIFDSAAQMYIGPLVYRADGEALRDFQQGSMNAETKFGQHPEHFSIYRVGSYDDHDAILIPENKVCLATAQELLAQSRQAESVAENVTKLKESTA